MQYYIGCSGWSYTSWQGPFYPKSIENSKWLKYYSKVFNYVEIDSTFYRIPNEFMVKNWYREEKLLALLIQLPPSIDIVEGLNALRSILPYLDKSFRYAVEVRHRSWFQDLA
ncbi:MAG: DUF72 domain-containing protein, partial [Nitrososphaeraceae archaeon]